MSGLRKLSFKIPPLDPLPLRPGLALVPLARYKAASQLTAPPFAATPRRTLLPSTTTSNSHNTFRTYATKPGKMGVSKTTHQEGSGAQPQNGQTVTIEYTGFLKDTSKPDNKGKQFDSSVGRGDFVTKIGVGQVIKGWDEGVTQMKVGEKATLDISSDYGYGARGFPGHIPPNSDLIFDVHLKNVN